MEFCDNELYITDDLEGVNFDGERKCITIEFTNEPCTNIFLSKEDFEYFKKRISELKWED